MLYWIATTEREKIGPLEFDELRNYQGLTPDTLVWHAGLTTWKKAGEVAELAPLFATADVAASVVAPPAPQETAYRQETKERPKRPRTYIGWSIAALILCCTIPAIVAVVYGMQVGPHYDCDDYRGARKASANAELWLIVSIVFGLVSLPFSIILNLVL